MATEIEDKNRLIAEFLGYESNRYPNLPNTLHIDKDGIEYKLPLTAALYHEDWNWIMPVVKKINEPLYDGGIGEELQNAVNDWLPSANIKQVYQTAVDYIKWKNSLTTP